MTAAHFSPKILIASTAVCVGVGLALSSGLVTSAFAQTSQPNQPEASQPAAEEIILTAIPPRVGDNGELKAKPGEKIQTVIRVRNSSDKALAITSLAQDFVIGEDGETPVPVTEAISNRWSLASWITVSPPRQIVQPRQTVNVNVVITVPEDALPGGHYAMLMHEPSENLAGGPAGADAGAQSRVAQRVGSLIYFLVDGPINEEAFIRGFDFKNLSEYGPVPYSFTVENMSDVHIKPKMKIEVFNIFGQRVDEIVPEEKNVFPLMSRKFDGQWTRIWGIGLYTAKMTMNFGSTGQIVMAKDQFWLIPYKIVLAGLVILLALVGMIVVIRRHLHHRQNAEQSRIQELEQKVQDLENQRL
jgi:hypothetical protein